MPLISIEMNRTGYRRFITGIEKEKTGGSVTNLKSLFVHYFVEFNEEFVVNNSRSFMRGALEFKRDGLQSNSCLISRALQGGGKK